MTVEGREVAGLGGLHVLGTERHEARRIDLQLVGRSGRQGDPGSSRFYLSLEDDLMRIFAGDWVKKWLERLGMQEHEAIESRMVTRRIEAAQKKVEERNFEIRKNLLEYDEVMDEQRKRVYTYRQRLLDGTDCRKLLFDMIDQQVEDAVDKYLAVDFGREEFAAFAGSHLGIKLEGRVFRHMDYESAEEYARDEAERLAETQLIDAMDENLPAEEEIQEWNWDAMAKWANRRWGLNLRDRDLKKLGADPEESRELVVEFLLEKSRAAIAKIDLEEGKAALDDDFGRRCVAGWAHDKFTLDLKPEDVSVESTQTLKDTLAEKARDVYREREAEFPVLAGFAQFTSQSPSGRLDREPLVAWARSRFEVDLDRDDLKNKQRDEIAKLLVEHSKTHQKKSDQLLAEIEDKLIPEIFTDPDDWEKPALTVCSGNTRRLDALVDWLKTNTGAEADSEELGKLDGPKLERRLQQAVEDRFRPEMSRMERRVVLDRLDKAWMGHLLTMDYIKNSVGMRGYGQMDPKIEYKREGMKAF
ncbi:MAG: preprotein translocase subunit SecA, partial [Planctomycetales bacterium]